MSDFALRMNHVFKRFRRGEQHDSLRDLIPALVKRAVRKDRERELAPQEFWVLNDISFDVRRGETLGIIGHNGAGKSTMLKHLSGIMVPTRGDIEVNGRLSALIEVGAGFHPDLTGRENVYLNGVILGMTRAEVKRKFDEIVDFAGLEEFIDTPVKRYSSGMFARLGFSVAAHLEPDILIIDEVLSVGDFAFQRKGLEKMRAIAKSGATVIFVSHNLQAVAEFCQRGILLERGRVIADGPTDHVIRRYLDTASGYQERTVRGPVRIVGAAISGADGEIGKFYGGCKARIRVTLEATAPVEKVAVVIQLFNADFYDIFHTSSERLGHPPLTLAAGQKAECDFDVDLHLGAGTYYLGVYLYRYDAEHEYDHIFPATSFVMTTDRGTQGVVNIYPEVARFEVQSAPGPALFHSRKNSMRALIGTTPNED
ncbi:MAG TPA: ABC transporter ATP-binding protein [Gemmatimonadaceae bacterium]|nr:ABC transporter ATP-binding protein [Gemmatimonadaceae bacterium]